MWGIFSSTGRFVRIRCDSCQCPCAVPGKVYGCCAPAAQFSALPPPSCWVVQRLESENWTLWSVCNWVLVTFAMWNSEIKWRCLLVTLTFFWDFSSTVKVRSLSAGHTMVMLKLPSDERQLLHDSHGAHLWFLAAPFPRSQLWSLNLMVLVMVLQESDHWCVPCFPFCDTFLETH